MVLFSESYQSVAAQRKLGLFLATMLVASSMVGSGIFLLPATLAGIGSVTTLAWVLATIGALIIARVLGRLSCHRPLAGGPCTYAAHALGRAMGFQATAIYWLALWTGNIAIALAAIGYLASLFPFLARTLPLALGSIACIWILSAVNLLGPRRVCQIESASLFVGLIPVLLVGIAGWWWFHPAIFTAGWNQSGEPVGWALAHSLAPTFWAFAGVESASIATALIRDPERNVARATYWGVMLAAAVYLAACTAMMGMIPAPVLA
ncbi:MAG: amino acid permease, partial [Terriglobales bacterium]